MVRWRLGEVLKERKWTAYRLVMESGLKAPTVYRIARSRGPVRRIDGRTLDRICAALDVQPREVLEFVSDERVRRWAGIPGGA